MYNLDGLSRTRGCCLFIHLTRVIQLPIEEQAFPLNISHKDPEIRKHYADVDSRTARSCADSHAITNKGVINL